MCVPTYVGSLVMEHPGASASPIQGKPIIYGSVHGAVGKLIIHVHVLLSWVYTASKLG